MIPWLLSTLALYLGRDIPQGAAGLPALAIWVEKLFSLPRHASMKNSLGLPTRSWTSHTSVTRLSMFQVLFPSLACYLVKSSSLMMQHKPSIIQMNPTKHYYLRLCSGARACREICIQ